MQDILLSLPSLVKEFERLKNEKKAKGIVFIFRDNFILYALVGEAAVARNRKFLSHKYNCVVNFNT